MQYQLLASDYDGTLAPMEGGGPRPAVVQAIRRAQAGGVRFVLCTGRCLAALRTQPWLLGGLQYDYAVCANGAQVVDAAGQTLFRAGMTSEEMYALVDFCEDYDYPLEFAFDDGYYAYVGYDQLQVYYEKMPNIGLTVMDGEDQNRHLREMPTAAFAALPPGGLERFGEKYGHLGITFIPIAHHRYNDGWMLYDIMHAGVDKSVGLAGLCRALDIPLAAVAAAGDGHNDIGMLKAAGLGCAMGNANDAVKAAADLVLPTVQQDGLAALAAQLWPEAQP